MESISDLVVAGRWDDVERMLTDLKYISARCEAGEVSELQVEYADALAAWPGNDEVEQREQRAEALAQYRDRLLRFARGEDATLVTVPSRRPVGDSADDLQQAEGGDITPQRRVLAFRQFVMSHAHLLTRSGGALPIVLQLAYNSAKDSPASRAAEALLEGMEMPLLLEPAHLRAAWNPFPALITTIEAHGDGGVQSLSFSADGQQLLSVGKHQMKIWRFEHQDTLNMQPKVMEIEGKGVNTAHLSADGQQIVTQGGSGLAVWSADGTCVHELAADLKYPSGLAVTADCMRAVSFSGRTLEEWDLSRGSELRSVETLSCNIDAIVMSADGRRIVSAHHDSIIRLHDLAGASAPIAVPLRCDEIKMIRFLPDLRLLIAYESDHEHFLAILGRGGEWELTWSLGEMGIDTFVVSGDGSRVFVALYGVHAHIIREVDLPTGRCTRTFQLPARCVFAALRGGDEDLIAITGEMWEDAGYVVDTWLLSTGDHLRHNIEWDGEKWVPHALLGDDLLVCSTEKTPWAWTLDLRSIATGYRHSTLGTWRRETLRDVVIVSNDGRRIFTGSWDRGILEWSVETGAPAQTVGLKGYTVREFDADVEGNIGISSCYGKHEPIRIWDLRKFVCLREIPALSYEDARVCISADGRFAASADHEFVLRVWDGNSSEALTERCRLAGHRSSIESLSLTPDGNTLMSGSWDRTAWVWNLVSGEAHTLEGHAGGLRHVSLSADGKVGISWGPDDTLRVWDLVAAQEVKIFQCSGYDGTLNMTADGSRVATSTEEGEIKLWDIENGRLGLRERRHSWSVDTACLLPGGRAVVSGSRDGTIGIWDLTDRSKDVVMEASDEVGGWDPEGIHDILAIEGGFVSTGGDSAIRIWGSESRTCLAVLCENQVSMRGCNQAWLAAAADSLRLISSNDSDPIRVWDIASRECIRAIQTGHLGGPCFCLSASGRIVVALGSSNSEGEQWDQQAMRLWDLENGLCLGETPLNDLPYRAKVTARGDHVLIDAGGKIELWNLMRGELVWSVAGSYAALSPSGGDTVVSSADEIYSIELATGRRKVDFPGASGHLSAFRITPDGKWLVTAGFQDRTIRVWSMGSGECIAIDYSDSVPSALSRISAQGLFAVGTDGGEVLIRQIHGIEFGPAIVTPVRRWIGSDQPHWEEYFVVCCPECAQITPVSEAMLGTSSVFPCPGCQTPLQLTTFSVDERGWF